jgi:anti-anti-sigma factor
MIASLLSRWLTRPDVRPAPPRPAPPADAWPARARPEPGVEVAVDSRPDDVVIRLAGEAGFRQAGALLNGLLVPAALRPVTVTPDLSGLNFISCLAMGVLVSYRRGVVRRGGQVRLRPDLRPPVRDALQRAGLLELFGERRAA